MGPGSEPLGPEDAAHSGVEVEPDPEDAASSEDAAIGPEGSALYCALSGDGPRGAVDSAVEV